LETNLEMQAATPGLPEGLLNNVSGGAIWPETVMTGAAGQFAKTYGKYLETPEAFLFMGYLTFLGHIISGKVTLKSEIAPQPRLYTVLLGESADTRKSTAINKCHDFFREAVEREVNPICGVGSAEGLAKGLERQKRVILILDELQSLVQKCQIDGSALLTCVSTLFEKDFYQNETSRGSVLVDGGQLSILAASTLDTYETMFKSQFLNIGFNNRLFVVIGNGRRRFAIPKRIPDVERRPLLNRLQEVLGFVNDLAHTGCFALPIDPHAEAIFEQWYHMAQGSIFSKRLDTYGHRLMVLMAANAMEDRVTPEVADQTVTLLRYQLSARQQADPIKADNQVARIEEKIRRLVGAGPIRKRSLEQRGHKGRVGSYLWKVAIRNLENDGEIYFDSKAGTYTVPCSHLRSQDMAIDNHMI
jgi:hypothetical protein